MKQHRATDESCHRRCHVVPDNIMLLCFLYCAQVLWENWCLYNKSCSYGNQDGYLFVEDRRICLVHTAAMVDSICRCDHLPAVSLQRKDEANANITHDSFRLVTDSWRQGILWLPHAVWLQLRWARFSLSSWTAVSHWLSSSGVGRHHSSWWVWRPCRS